MKTSIKKLNIFAQASSMYLKQNTKETKLKLAIKEFSKQIPAIFDEYNNALAVIDINRANEDSNGSILYSEEQTGTRKYEFSREGLLLRDKERRELFNAEDVEVTPVIAASVPSDLPADLKEIFSGLVIK